MAEPSIDGALVGGASLKPDEMAALVARAGLTARARLGAAGGGAGQRHLRGNRVSCLGDRLGHGACLIRERF